MNTTIINPDMLLVAMQFNKVTQVQLAKKIGVSQCYVSKLLEGARAGISITPTFNKISVKLINKIALYLRFDVKYLQRNHAGYNLHHTSFFTQVKIK